MASNPVETSAPSQESIVAPLRTDSGPAKSLSSVAASITRARTEPPRIPEQIYNAFERPASDVVPIGNTQYEMSLRLSGKLGHFLPRDVAATSYTHIELRPAAMQEAIFCTIREVARRKLLLRGYIEAEDVQHRVDNMSTHLTTGVMIMTYMKLRSVNILIAGQANTFSKKPKVPVPFEIPTPYALAISQLGVVKVSSLIKELILVPTVPAADGANFCLPTGILWSPTRYAEAVEYAKSIGLRFATVDLQVKLGSSWWLFNQVFENNVLILKCILPEDNYTEATAVLHTLFCMNINDGVHNVFVDLSPLDQNDYGLMLSDPPPSISATTYFAVDDDPEQIWNYV